MSMKKNTIWIIVGVVAILLICCVVSIAGYFIYTRGGFSVPAAVSTPFIFPTPNSTLTALYSIPTLELPTATQQFVAPTYSGYPTATNTATFSAFPLITPGATITPYIARPAGAMEAAYLSTAPTLDGTWDEWDTTEYPLNVVVYGGGSWESNNDLLGSYRIGWDYSYLYLAVKVHDDKYTQVSTGEYIYMGDSIEVLVDTNLAGDLTVRSLDGDDYQIGISPGRPTPGVNTEAYLWYPVSLTGGRSSIRIAGRTAIWFRTVKLPPPVYRTSIIHIPTRIIIPIAPIIAALEIRHYASWSYAFTSRYVTKTIRTLTLINIANLSRITVSTSCASCSDNISSHTLSREKMLQPRPKSAII